MNPDFLTNLQTGMATSSGEAKPLPYFSPPNDSPIMISKVYEGMTFLGASMVLAFNQPAVAQQTFFHTSTPALMASEIRNAVYPYAANDSVKGLSEDQLQDSFSGLALLLQAGITEQSQEIGTWRRNEALSGVCPLNGRNLRIESYLYTGERG